jgi:hypothetical protein
MRSSKLSIHWCKRESQLVPVKATRLKIVVTTAIHVKSPRADFRASACRFRGFEMLIRLSSCSCTFYFSRKFPWGILSRIFIRNSGEKDLAESSYFSLALELLWNLTSPKDVRDRGPHHRVIKSSKERHWAEKITWQSTCEFWYLNEIHDSKWAHQTNLI